MGLKQRQEEKEECHEVPGSVVDVRYESHTLRNSLSDQHLPIETTISFHGRIPCLTFL